MVEQVSVFLENTSGRLAQLTRALGDAGIDMHALMVADTSEFGVVRIICDAPVKAKAVLEENGFGASITRVIAVEVPDRPGGLADVLETLDRHAMNVEYAYCFVKPSGGSAIDVLKIDAQGAEEALSSAGFRVFKPADLYSTESS
jgi:hypothetical protein